MSGVLMTKKAGSGNGCIDCICTVALDRYEYARFGQKPYSLRGIRDL